MARRIEPVDAAVGGRVRAYRLSQRMSQAELGRKVGVTFQQIQKYETGANRIGSSRLAKFANALGVQISALFGDEESGRATHSGFDPFVEVLAQPYAARLLKAFGAIRESKLRLSLVQLAETLGEARSKR
jgi:transcriptional regulator with XRE-family HTH domain